MRATFTDPELQRRFEQDGYVVVPLLDAHAVVELRRSFDRLGHAPGDPGVACHSSFHSADREYKVRVDSDVRSVLRPALDRVLDRQRMLPCNYIVKWPGAFSGFGLHQDLSLVDERIHRSAEVWVALDETTTENGMLWMVPGSHRWIPTIRGISAFPFPFASVSERIVRRHARPVPVAAGEAVVFNHATLHFSMPNRTSRPRLVAITDVIPEEAQHLHFFGNGEGEVDAYEIGDSFWTDNNPFTLWKPPPGSQLVGPVDFAYRELTDDALDRLVSDGLAIDAEGRPGGSINAAVAWCHRCAAQMSSLEAPNRLIGNVTLLCSTCAQAESGSHPAFRDLADQSASA